MTNVKGKASLLVLLALIPVLLIITANVPAYAATANFASANVTSSTQMTVKFDIPVDFDTSNINYIAVTEANGTQIRKSVDSVSGTGTSTMTITFSGAGNVYTNSTGQVSITALADLGSGNTLSVTNNQTANDGQKPTITITSSLISPTSTNPIPIRIEASESLSNFNTTSAITVSGGTMGTVTTSGNIYTFDVTPSANPSTITVDVAADSGRDSAGWYNTAGTFTITYNLFVPSSGNWCSGDCVPPTIGLDSNGRRLVEWPVMYKTSTLEFIQLAEYYHTPMKDFTVKVGDTNTLAFVIYENSGYEAIRQIGLSIGVPFNGGFNDGAAQLRWFAAPLGQIVDDNSAYVEESDPNDIFEMVSFHQERVACSPKAETTDQSQCMAVVLKYKFREAPKDTAVRLDLWDEDRNAFQHVLNDGVTVEGESMNPPDVFAILDNRGRLHTLTETGYTTAVDESGVNWNLINDSWVRDFVALDMTCSGTQRECVSGQKALILEQQVIATEKFDSSTIQGKLAPTKAMATSEYGRGHNSVPNMQKALIEHLIMTGVNKSSYQLD